MKQEQQDCGLQERCEPANTVQEILTRLQQRIDGAVRNEGTAQQQWLAARSDEERAVACYRQQISIGQRLVLQGIIDEFQCHEPAITLDGLPFALSLEENGLHRIINRWYQQYDGTSKEAVATLAFFLLKQRSLHPRGVYAVLRERLAHKTDDQAFQGMLYAFLSDLVEQSYSLTE